MKGIQDIPRPTSITKLRQFLGLINFYRRLLPKFARLVQPQENLLTKKSSNAPTHLWNESLDHAFCKVKTALAEATLHLHPRHDAQTAIMTDASDTAVGAVLPQQIDNVWHPIAFFSKKLTTAQTRYSVFGRELLGTTWLCATFDISSRGGRSSSSLTTSP